MMRDLCGLLARIQAIFACIHLAGAKLALQEVFDQGEAHMVAAAAERLAGPAPPIPRAARIALFVDLDGTVFEFATTPDGVSVDVGLSALLRDLCSALDGALAIISGRPLATIDSLLHWPQVTAAAQHGAELRFPDGRLEYAAIQTQALDAARWLLHTRSPRADDVRIEDKGVALAIHYREYPSAEPFARELAVAALRAAGAGFELQHGAFVIELKSARVDKGRALAALMSQAPFAEREPWVLGDDYADEHAFAVAQALGGSGVVVGTRTDSIAHFQLAGPVGARAWLTQILRHGGNRS
jgi:trehalose 6-phosphate phosphatase